MKLCLPWDKIQATPLNYSTDNLQLNLIRDSFKHGNFLLSHVLKGFLSYRSRGVAKVSWRGRGGVSNLYLKKLMTFFLLRLLDTHNISFPHAIPLIIYEGLHCNCKSIPLFLAGGVGVGGIILTFNPLIITIFLDLFLTGWGHSPMFPPLATPLYKRKTWISYSYLKCRTIIPLFGKKHLECMQSLGNEIDALKDNTWDLMMSNDFHQK